MISRFRCKEESEWLLWDLVRLKTRAKRYQVAFWILLSWWECTGTSDWWSSNTFLVCRAWRWHCKNREKSTSLKSYSGSDYLFDVLFMKMILLQYTAVGVVESGTLQPYSPTNFPTADPISLLRKGSYSLKQLHDLERRDANIHTWKYRLLGFVQVFASAMTLHPDWVTICKYSFEVYQKRRVHRPLVGVTNCVLVVAVLQCQWISSSLRRCTRVWINFVLSFSYTLLVISVPWYVLIFTLV